MHIRELVKSYRDRVESKAQKERGGGDADVGGGVWSEAVHAPEEEKRSRLSLG